MTAFAIVVAPAAIFIMSFFATIIITTWVAIRAGSTSNVVLELPISFFGVYVRVYNLEEFTDGLGSLAVKFGAQLLMVMGSRDGLAVPDVGDGVPCFGETLDVAS